MPKRVGYIYDRMKNKDFIRDCILKGSERKRHRWDVVIVLDDLEYYVDKVYEIVCNFDYTPTPIIHKKIFDPSSNKWRIISVQPFYPDGIMQQLVVTAMKDILMRGMHKYSCASIPSRGGTYALKYQRKMIQRKKKSSKYAAELDIKQFYPSIPQRHVITALEHKIKDKKFIMLVAVIISVFPRGLKYAIKNKMTAYDIVSDKIGIDIGFYINQWLSNYLLEPIDRFINSCDGIKGECRYADNINLFASNKRKLHRAVRALQNKLKRLGLRLKENWQIFPINARPLSSVGYRIARGFVLLRKRNFLRLTRQARRIMKKIKNHRKIPECMARSIISRIGQLGRCNSLKIKQKYIYPIGIKRLLSIISKADRAIYGIIAIYGGCKV